MNPQRKRVLVRKSSTGGIAIVRRDGTTESIGGGSGISESRDAQHGGAKTSTRTGTTSSISNITTSKRTTGASRKSNVQKLSTSTAPESKVIRHLEWFCTGCNRTCVNLNPEARCLCGHRLKEHLKTSTPKTRIACKASRCKCRHFYYLFGQGSFLLRCQCKHKGIEHDPLSKKCLKPQCRNTCSKFESPFVCNCNCAWKMHVQREVVLRPRDAEDFAKAHLGELDVDVGNASGVQRGVVG